jgi:hypothetical protein
MVSVGGRAYGPYTDAQMTAFAAEGRLTPQSLISRSGEEALRCAGDEADLAHLFAPAPEQSDPGEGAHDSMPRADAKPGGVFGRGKDDALKPGERAHVVIIADMKSRSINGLEEEIYKLGQACPILPQVWLLRTDQTINTVRNLLVQQLGTLDSLFVVDATHDKAAWFNFGPEAESRIRRLWSRGQDEHTKARAAEG